MELTKEQMLENLSAVYKRANQLNLAGYQITIMENYGKKPKHTNWQNLYSRPEPGMTAVGIVGGSLVKYRGVYIYIIDIDIYRPEKRDEVYQEILNLFGTREVYVEATISGGYHIIFHSEKEITSGNKRYHFGGGDKIEFFHSHNGQVLVAPSMAKRKNESTIRFYIQISEVDIINSAVITEAELNDLVIGLDTLSLKYQSGSLDKDNKKADSNRQTTAKNQSDSKLTKEEIDTILKRMHPYGLSSEIDKQIKAIFQNPKEMFDALDIKYDAQEYKNSLKFFSIAEDDGNNPGAVLYFNRNKSTKYKWAGYSVKDFHNDKMTSLAKYLCLYSPDRFKSLMDLIGYGKGKTNGPIETEYSGKTVTIDCNGYITDEVRARVLNLINETVQNKDNARIIVTAPTGIGKTEMFYKLAREQARRMIMALSYTAQVRQGKEHHTVPGVIEGLCDREHIVPVNGSIFMTYDKAPIVKKAVAPKDYIMVIDEAHNLVNHINFRNSQLTHLMNLSERCRAIVYMTATPDYINFKDIDLVIKIGPQEPEIKQATVVHYHKQLLNKLSNVILKHHAPGTIDVVYVRNRSILEKLNCIINSNGNIETHIIKSDLKSSSAVFDNLMDHDRLAANGIFSSGGVLLTTNLIVDGVNILDGNIGNIYLGDQFSTTDLIQFPARFRNGYQKYYIFSTGTEPMHAPTLISRSLLSQKYYNIAKVQKGSYDKINKLIRENCFIAFHSGGKKIQLVDQYEMLDGTGKIQHELILFKVQWVEAMRNRWDIDYLKEYMKSYNYDITEESIDNLMDSSLDENSEGALILRDEDTISLTKQLIFILHSDSDEKKEIISDYLKTRKQDFDKLKNRYNIGLHESTKKYDQYLSDSTCKNLLFNWCTGEDLGADNSLKLLLLDDSKIDSLKRTYNNLMNEISSNLIHDHMYIRFTEVRNWVRELKYGNESVLIDKGMIENFRDAINLKFNGLYNAYNIKGVVSDLHDIFDVEKKRKSNKTTYVVGKEWTLNDIRGITFV